MGQVAGPRQGWTFPGWRGVPTPFVRHGVTSIPRPPHTCEGSAPSMSGPAVATGPRSSPAIRHATGLALLVALAHGVNDAYASFLAPLLPRIMDKLGLSVALAASLAMILSIASSMVQPLAGYLSDRYGRRVFIALGPILSGVFLSLIGWAPTFAILVVLLALGGLGSASFHPPGAAMATRIADGGGSGMRLSIFSFGGAMGFALGPLIAVAVVAQAGLEGLWIAMIPGVVLGLALLKLLPPGRPHPDAAPPPGPRQVLRYLKGPLGLIFGISALGAFTQRVFLTMGPIASAQAGVSEAGGAVVLSVYLAAQGAGTLFSGWLTDRVNRQKLLVTLTLLTFPAHMLAIGVTAGTGAALGFAIVAGFLNMALLPPVVVMAQEMLPEGTAVSSGIAMGLAWAVGSIGVLGTGVLGDFVGARNAALLSFPLVLIATFLAVRPGLRPFSRPIPHPEIRTLPEAI